MAKSSFDLAIWSFLQNFDREELFSSFLHVFMPFHSVEKPKYQLQLSSRVPLLIKSTIRWNAFGGLCKWWQSSQRELDMSWMTDQLRNKTILYVFIRSRNSVQTRWGLNNNKKKVAELFAVFNNAMIADLYVDEAFSMPVLLWTLNNFSIPRGTKGAYP